MKELWGAKHVTIYSPLLSTPVVGPQSKFNDGFCPLKRNKDEVKITDAIYCTSGMGACVVWTSIYRLLADVYSTRFDNDIDLINFLKKNPLVGEESALDLLGKVMFNSFKHAKVHKPFMNAIYDFIPNRNEIDMDNLLSKFNGIMKKNKEFIENQRVLFLKARTLKRMDKILSQMPPGYDKDLKEFVALFISDKQVVNQILAETMNIIGERERIKDIIWRSEALENIYSSILILINCKLKANLI